MNNDTKVIALYLPQFHEIKENNEWWGNGHTEWVSCKNSRPFDKTHYQPKVPLNNMYYDLTDSKAQEWQSKLASKYGIYGFCYYHYWFEGKLLLEKPAENMLNNKEIKINFCFSWANHNWENKIERRERKILIKQSYGDKEQWTKHFMYLLNFFLDERYIKVDNKPMFVIYNVEHIHCWLEMKELWIDLAIKHGFKGIHFVNTLKHEIDPMLSLKYQFDAQFEYQPAFSMSRRKKIDYSQYIYVKRVVCKDFLSKPSVFKYDKIVKRSYKLTPKNGVKTYLGVFTDWDITARWKSRGMYLKGSTPTKFGVYLQNQINRIKNEFNSDYVFITAWNEWSEGAYLEPDEKNKYSYLEQIKKVMEKENTND